ncbi:MAG: CCA tRNA nucleotidyltransferase [Eggerthellaceae bacterium]|nr:CCA tRNA nucleotidyltransferase [Eggerthellaceae bacterium]
MDSPIANIDANIESISLPKHAIRVLELVEAAGFEAWAVGGFVRDALLGRPVHDVDLATSATWQQVQSVCEAAGQQTCETGVAHGTLSVLVDDETIEVTTYRSDGTYSDARHPDEVNFVSSIEEDLARRDFTINALAWHPTRALLDCYGGVEDLKAGVIRAVGVAEKRFAEDALRIVRAVRFASELGFSIEEDTLTGANAQVEKLERIAVERKVAEMTRLLCGQNVRAILMDYPTIIDAVLPELRPMRNLDQKSRYHIYDVMEHTAYVVANTAAEPLLRWAALLHDVGKPAAFHEDEKGRGHFFGHAKIGAEMAAQIMKRFKMTPRFAADVELLVRYHDTHIQAEPASVKRLLHKLSDRPELMRALCELQIADALAHHPDYTERSTMAEEVLQCLEEVLAQDEAFSLKHLAVNGDDVLALGIEPGPRVGEVLEEALAAVMSGEVPNSRGSLLEFIRSADRSK